MKSEHLIKMRGGNEHLAYPGLLDEAWKNWLREIDTEIIQIPTPDNGMLAIVKAVATFDDPEDPSGQPKRFSGIGDASPESVGSKAMVPHILRLSETRAKARALRDGVNIGAIDFEDGETHGEVRHKPEEKSGEHPAKLSGGDKTPGGASKPSARYLYGLLKKPDMSDDEKKNLQDWVGSLSQQEVSKHIDLNKPEEEEEVAQ